MQSVPLVIAANSFNTKTPHRTAGSFIANIEAARPSVAAVSTAASRSVCKSAGSTLQGNQNVGSGGFD